MQTEIRRVDSSKDLKTFLDLPYRAYRNDLLWRPPLRFERRELLDPEKNPSLQHIDCQFFLAFRGAEAVGRICAHVNHRHLECHNDQTGHFGLFDVAEAGDQEVTTALLEAAEGWLRGRGMAAIAGPFNLSVNDDCGLLVEGFDTPPSVLMPFGRKDYPRMIEAAGYDKAMDMYALRHRMGETFEPPAFVRKLKARFDGDPEMTARPVDFSRFNDEVGIVVDIFNDAWSDNWGFIPLSDEEVAHMASSMRSVLRADGLWFGCINDTPVTFTLMLPNLNEAIHDIDGKLFPFGWAKLLYRLKLSRMKTGRIPLAGTRRSVHKTRRGMTATVGAWDACLRAQHARGIREVEFSWVLETNRDLLGLADIYDCDRYKTYRIYRKAL